MGPGAWNTKSFQSMSTNLDLKSDKHFIDLKLLGAKVYGEGYRKKTTQRDILAGQQGIQGWFWLILRLSDYQRSLPQEIHLGF